MKSDEMCQVTVGLAPSRALQIVRVAQDEGKDVVVLATELPETEIEARYGLRHGPFLRRFTDR